MDDPGTPPGPKGALEGIAEPKDVVSTTCDRSSEPGAASEANGAHEPGAACEPSRAKRRHECTRGCGKTFDRAVERRRHEASKFGCVGIIYLCQRCLAAFPSLAKVRRHQRRKRLCPRHNVCEREGRQPYVLPPVRRCEIRYAAAVRDCGGDARQYLRGALRRGQQNELVGCFTACTMSDFTWLVTQMRGYRRTDPHTQRLMMAAVDYIKQEENSPERAHRLKAFLEANLRF